MLVCGRLLGNDIGLCPVDCHQYLPLSLKITCLLCEICLLNWHDSQTQRVLHTARRVVSVRCYHMDETAYVASDFNCVIIEIEGLVKVTGGHVDCTCDNMSGTCCKTETLLQAVNRN